eukprot:CAMPEP_0119154522 /NCGR_PEP_ID=MMETSP1310-20130426/50914_2 /TAXON_ID=464262 /ORGANISM="Genus nov. species nov., Strain RCC2339" /LENGTH=45 /DNA_ID= /DNA_START= /DNA_END= /DNA_ORIENTATION=
MAGETSEREATPTAHVNRPSRCDVSIPGWVRRGRGGRPSGSEWQN